jgi:predicted enzyme related to lactoylglutathione lyase
MPGRVATPRHPEPKERAMERMKQGEFCWVDLSAKDLEAQTRFYEGLFGWTHMDLATDVGPIYREFFAEGALVSAGSTMNPELLTMGAPSQWLTYVAANDVDTLTQRAVDLGGQVSMPAMDVMDQGRMVGLMDPTGAPFMLWQAGEHRGAEKFMEAGALSWSELDTRDVERAKSFYADLLGWQFQELQGPPPYWQIEIDGIGEGGIMAIGGDMPADMPSSWLVYFAVEDVNASAEKVRELGGRIFIGPTEVPGMLSYAVCVDPQGAVFAIMRGYM